MAYVYSTAQTDTSHGNIDMSVNVFRGACTRTQTTATFSFGVRFTPNGKTVSDGGRGTRTSNSIAAWYGGVQRFAQASSGDVTAYKGTYYYAYYTDRTSSGHVNVNNTTETTCFTATVTGLSATSTSASIKIGVGWYDWAGTNRGSLTFSLPIPEYHGNVGKPDVWIEDHGNNTFTVGGTDGENGINNTASTKYSWGYDTNYSNSGKVTNRALTANDGDASKTVYAKAVTTGEHGSTANDTAYLPIMHYVAPKPPGMPLLSYTKSRLTLRDTWTFEWGASIQVNDSSPVMGYWIRLWRKPKDSAWVTVNGLIAEQKSDKDSQAMYISKSSKTDYCVWWENTLHKIIIEDPVSLGFMVGDTVQLEVYAYTKNKLGTKLWSADTATSDGKNYGVLSEPKEVQNAGVMHVKTTDEWQEGQVHVFKNNQWIEAEAILVYKNGEWVESE